MEKFQDEVVVKNEETSDTFLSFENSMGSMFFTPNPKTKETNSSRRRKYFNDEQAIGAFDPFNDKPPRFSIDDPIEIIGLNCSTPISKAKASLTPLQSIPLSGVKKNVTSITGVYPSVRIEEEESDDLFFVQDGESIANLTITENQQEVTVLKAELTPSEKLVAKTSQETPTHHPNYLRSTLASANKAINASISFQSAEGSPAHCPKLKNPRLMTPARNHRNGASGMKKVCLVDSFTTTRKKNGDAPLMEKSEEQRVTEDDIIFINEFKKKILNKKRKSEYDFLALDTREIKRSERSLRSRVMPLRPWLGERAHYTTGEDGLLTLQNVSCPKIRDKKLMRYILKNQKK